MSSGHCGMYFCCFTFGVYIDKEKKTVMKTTYRKLEPRIVHYRDFNYYNNNSYYCNNSFKELLRKAISQNLGVECDESFESFTASCNKILDNRYPNISPLENCPPDNLPP